MERFYMKENDAFFFIGDMPSFAGLLNDVLNLTTEDWTRYTERKKTGGIASKNTDTIPLMYDKKHRLNSKILHQNYEQFSMYIEEIVSSTWEHLGEVETQQAMLAKLNAGTVIPKHMDKGPLTAKTHRIHVPVLTNDGCLFSVGDESMNLKPGQIWIIDNVNRYHSVENNGNSDRVHLIIDAI
jgi:hypothetical protein